MELLIAFVVGMIVMDIMWAWRLGLVQVVFQFVKWKLFSKKPSQEESV